MSETKIQDSRAASVSKTTGVQRTPPPEQVSMVPQKPPVRVRVRQTGPLGDAKSPGNQNQTGSRPDVSASADALPRTSSGPETVSREGERPEEDYKVGYYRTPKHTRYKPGQSGNPKGRPRGRKNTATILAKSLGARVRVKTARGSKVVTRHEAFIEQFVLDAFREPRTREQLLRVILSVEAQADARKVTEAPDEHEGASDETYLAEFRRMVQRAGKTEPSRKGKPVSGNSKSPKTRGPTDDKAP